MSGLVGAVALLLGLSLGFHAASEAVAGLATVATSEVGPSDPALSGAEAGARAGAGAAVSGADIDSVMAEASCPVGPLFVSPWAALPAPRSTIVSDHPERRRILAVPCDRDDGPLRSSADSGQVLRV